MAIKDFISIQQFCTHYNVPDSFIHSLHEFELVEISTVEEIHCISVSQIKDIEKMMRLHYELDINMEGMDAIYRLLNQVETLQQEIIQLKNRLSFYEP